MSQDTLTVRFRRVSEDSGDARDLDLPGDGERVQSEAVVGVLALPSIACHIGIDPDALRWRSVCAISVKKDKADGKKCSAAAEFA